METEYDDNFLPALQLLVGSEFSVNAKWSLYGELRYTFAGNIDMQPSDGNPDVSADYSGASALAGLRYRF